MDLKKYDFHNHKLSLEKLLALHNKHKNEKSENAKKIRHLEQDNEELTQRLFALNKSKAALKQENLSLQQKMENSKLKERSKDVKFLYTVCELLGYHLSDIVWDEEHRIQLATCYFNKDCYVRLGISSANALMGLLEIVPQHPNFKFIEEHFLSTQDPTGLLAVLRKYFNAVE